MHTLTGKDRKFQHFVKKALDELNEPYIKTAVLQPAKRQIESFVELVEADPIHLKSLVSSKIVYLENAGEGNWERGNEMAEKKAESGKLETGEERISEMKLKGMIEEFKEFYLDVGIMIKKLEERKGKREEMGNRISGFRIAQKNCE